MIPLKSLFLKDPKNKDSRANFSALEIAVLLVGASLPTPVQLNNIAIGILIVVWIRLLFLRSLSIDINKSSVTLILLVILYIISLVGMFDVNRLDIFKHSAEINLSLLIFPIIFGTTSRSDFHRLLWLGSVGFIVIIFIYTIIFNFQFALNWSHIDVHNRLPVEIISPFSSNYFAFQIIVALILLIYYHSKKKISSLYSIIAGAMLAIAVVLIANKISIIALLISLFYLISKLVGLKRGILFIMIISLTTTSLILSIPSSKSRFKSIINQEFTFRKKDIDAQNSITMRVEKWKCATKLFIANPWIGYGASTQENLNTCYKSNGFWGWVKSYNSHNQYLDLALKFGVMGLLIIILIMFIPLIKALKNGDILFASFLILFIIIFLTENVMERQKGIVIFVFFYSLMTQRSLSLNQENIMERDN